jgi:hypothetical protein
LVSFELEVGETAISFISSCQNPTHHIPNYVHSMGLVMCESMWEVLCPVLVQSLWGVLFNFVLKFVTSLVSNFGSKFCDNFIRSFVSNLVRNFGDNFVLTCEKFAITDRLMVTTGNTCCTTQFLFGSKLK